MIGHYYFMKFFKNRKKKGAKLLGYICVLLLALAVFSAYSQLNPPARPIGVARNLLNSSGLSAPLAMDAIPALDDPKFVSSGNATFIGDDDKVIGVNYNGLVKAYPIRIINWHEVVNDHFYSKPVVVTYCTMCGGAIAFDSRALGKPLAFGVSGLLYNSNLLMFDRETKSYWSQMTGQAVVGDMVGKTLNTIPIDVVTWKQWKEKYPSTLVLSNDTGYDRDYTFDPYGGYADTAGIWYKVTKLDERLFTKDLVYGVSLGGFSKAYPESNVTAVSLINDELGNDKILVLRNSELGSVRVFNRVVRGSELSFEIVNGILTDKQTKSAWNTDGAAVAGPLISEKLSRIEAKRVFWFVWAAFYPETDLFMFRNY